MRAIFRLAILASLVALGACGDGIGVVLVTVVGDAPSATDMIAIADVAGATSQAFTIYTPGGIKGGDTFSLSFAPDHSGDLDVTALVYENDKNIASGTGKGAVRPSESTPMTLYLGPPPPMP